MYVKSIAVTDYSTGTQYTYSGTDGTWQSIKSTGGTINSSGKGATPIDSSAPAITSVPNSAPIPFEGTHRDASSSAVKSGWPWVGTTMQTSATSTATSYPGLPAGWTVSSSGKAIPPSNAASVSEPPLLSAFRTMEKQQLTRNLQSPSLPTSTLQVSSPQASPAGGGYNISTGWDQQGFATTYTVADSAATQKPQYNQQGFLVTSTPTIQPSAQAVDSTNSAAPKVQVHEAVTTGGAKANKVGPLLGVACLGGALLL